ncbi:hypothetical protein NGRA_0885 [Nosema granulosis]|uniref:Zinc-ribbon 15 domain-containing protein n=1 Tax=Nosema granulosis TaxID=83296 RepID=A0A9P6H2Q7_9MICR|nr:hypothetical protein NGRA_0885 [Nosema granulosis]
MIWIFGCDKKTRTITRPESYPSPPQRIICPNCGDTTQGIYKQDYERFWFCFIPCCCTCSYSDPYIACINCHRPLGVLKGNTCNGCGLVTTFKSDNCPSCGRSNT